jgi:hypothetical protein
MKPVPVPTVELLGSGDGTEAGAVFFICEVPVLANGACIIDWLPVTNAERRNTNKLFIFQV